MKKAHYITRFILPAALLLLFNSGCSQSENAILKKGYEPDLYFTVSIPSDNINEFHVQLSAGGFMNDTVEFKLPRWMPGYYQVMNYSEKLKNISARDRKGKDIPVSRINQNTWQIVTRRNSSFELSYDIVADRRFVANNYLDSTRAYIVPPASFLYITGHLGTPVSVSLKSDRKWNMAATGLDSVPGRQWEFIAPDFDILYDCPILIGNLEELPSFMVNGVEHRFIGYRPGNFNRDEFILNLKKIVQAAADIIGDVPYSQYTFIAIGPGNGGIEHLNNTTVSFNGNGLDSKASMIRMMNFLGHEYFHNYNVKRIRPYELGPFDYDRENRTNLLWVSEGLSVYYEYLMVKRAGLTNEQEFLSSLANNITTVENDSGRFYQSLAQSSYNTWDEGPFGNRGRGPDRSISYYEKGPVVGFLLDLAIRNYTGNERSLDDVMRYLYREYYKKMNQGFTDAEFQQACENIAGTSMSREFEYAYTAKEIDYSAYLPYAGLQLEMTRSNENGTRRYHITRSGDINRVQQEILSSLLGEKSPGR